MKLNLNWTLNSTEERMEFARTYIENNHAALTEANMNSISEYILWTLDDSTLGLEARNSPWKKGKGVVSFDELQERAEQTGRAVDSLLDPTPYPKRRAKLDRNEVSRRLGYDDETSLLLSSGQHHPMGPQWISLWFSIDELEYGVQWWEGLHGKRRADLPIRVELVRRIEWHGERVQRANLIEDIQSASHDWNAKTFLTKKRLLVSRRSEQYQLLDILRGEGRRPLSQFPAYYMEDGGSFEGFYPFTDNRLLFPAIAERHFEKDFQEVVVNQLRSADRYDDEIGKPLMSGKVLNLTNGATIRGLLHSRKWLEEAQDDMAVLDKEMTIKLLKYLDYYLGKAELSADLLMIMDMKVQGYSNKDIANRVEEELGVQYKENYVSTVYTKRVVEAIAAEAKRHLKLVEYLSMGRTVFKICNTCYELLPRNREYFNKRSSTGDGFISYCKKCKKKKKGRRNL